MIRNSHYAPAAHGPRSFAVPIVGEQHYQEAIRTCRVGERVVVSHEPDNPFDEMALKVETSRGQCIGYVAKDNWLRRAIHDKGQRCTATILRIRVSNRGITRIVLAVVPRQGRKQTELSTLRQVTTSDEMISCLRFAVATARPCPGSVSARIPWG